MTKLENRCANCGGKFGLVCHHHWGLRFCRKACKDNFLAKTAKDHARMRRWLGFLRSRYDAGSGSYFFPDVVSRCRKELLAASGSSALLHTKTKSEWASLDFIENKILVFTAFLEECRSRDVAFKASMNVCEITPERRAHGLRWNRLPEIIVDRVTQRIRQPISSNVRTSLGRDAHIGAIEAWIVHLEQGAANYGRAAQLFGVL